MQQETTPTPVNKEALPAIKLDSLNLDPETRERVAEVVHRNDLLFRFIPGLDKLIACQANEDGAKSLHAWAEQIILKEHSFTEIANDPRLGELLNDLGSPGEPISVATVDTIRRFLKEIQQKQHTVAELPQPERKNFFVLPAAFIQSLRARKLLNTIDGKNTSEAFSLL